MKTQEFKREFNYAKRALRSTVNKIMLARMVADNIADLIPQEWQLTNRGSYYLQFRPAEGATVTIADLAKLATKLAKAFNKEPAKTVTKDTVDFTWYSYPAFLNKWDWTESVMIEFAMGNTEKCEFIKKRKSVTQFEPTGYCKALKEKQYLTTHN
jgi:hypothetical protein